MVIHKPLSWHQHEATGPTRTSLLVFVFAKGARQVATGEGDLDQVCHSIRNDVERLRGVHLQELWESLTESHEDACQPVRSCSMQALCCLNYRAQTSEDCPVVGDLSGCQQVSHQAIRQHLALGSPVQYSLALIPTSYQYWLKRCKYHLLWLQIQGRIHAVYTLQSLD